MRVAVVDIGSNSTRLLIADVDPDDGRAVELLRRSEVTRLGAGLDAHGSLSAAGIERVLLTLACYRRLMDRSRVQANLAVLTAAVREAANGRAFAARVRDEFGLRAEVLSGEQEALLTFRGATFELGDDGHPADGAAAAVVIDIGGASTEFVVGTGRDPRFHTSLPMGVVRMSERHIKSDPPHAQELAALEHDVRSILERRLPAVEREPVQRAIAVAGTATSAAAMDQQLEPYDVARVHGYVLTLPTVKRLLERTAAMSERQRRELAGLHPKRAPTIVAGLVILAEALQAFALCEATVSEHDILYGGALRVAGIA